MASSSKHRQQTYFVVNVYILTQLRAIYTVFIHLIFYPSLTVLAQYLTYEHDNGERCFYPSVDGLDAIYESYPYASFVNVVRNTESWYESLKSWSHSSLFVRIRLCNATGFPNGQSNKTEIMAMYDGHNAMIRQFVADRPTLTYLEIQLEAPETASILAQATGIDSACWKQCKPQERKCEEDRVKAAGSKAKEEETIN